MEKYKSTKLHKTLQSSSFYLTLKFKRCLQFDTASNVAFSHRCNIKRNLTAQCLHDIQSHTYKHVNTYTLLHLYSTLCKVVLLVLNSALRFTSYSTTATENSTVN